MKNSLRSYQFDNEFNEFVGFNHNSTLSSDLSITVQLDSNQLTNNTFKLEQLIGCRQNQK